MRLTSFLFALLLIGTAAQAADPVTPTQCGPGPAGSTCDGSGPASQGNSSDTDQGAGNPINVITGNKYQQEVDLPALPGVLGLEIVRHYNSSQSDPRTPPGITGRSWKLSYETDLHPIGNTLQIVQADGTRIIFVRDPKNPSQCATNDSARGTLAITKTPRGEKYVWTWTNGRTLAFNHQGRLTEIRAPTGEFVSLTRDTAGALVKVTDPQGRSLVLGYPAHRSAEHFNGVTHIDSPVGRFGYTYGSAPSKGTAGNPRDQLANLVRVDLPGAIRRHYHYEDPTHPTFLTGISAAGQGAKPQRINTWAYDPQGRGILSVKGEPKRLGQDGKPVPGTGIEQVRLDFGTPGKTLLTNSLDQTTTYTHAIVGNEYRLLKVTGAGCASCGETNIQYGYDTLGRLTEATQLSPTGQPLATTRTERDAWGRPIKISRIAYHNGKAQPARLQVRYEYAGQSTQPSLFARPSVIAGKEAITRIAWNAYGQPAQVTESGFSPLDEKGQANPTPIARTTTYAYRSINGRSLLTQVDGPLPNGKTHSPADSDITRLEWDGRGDQLVGVTRPMNLTETVEYDEAGRPYKLIGANGVVTETRRNLQGQLLATWRYPASLDRQAAKHAGLLLATTTRHDILGRAVQITRADGQGITLAYDANGKLARLSDTLGNRVEWKDWNKGTPSEDGNVTTQQWFTADAPAHVSRAWYFWHDRQGRLTQRLSPDGGLDEWRYPDGSSASAESSASSSASGWLTHIDPLGRVTAQARNTSGAAHVRIAPDGEIQARLSATGNATPPLQTQDDFGRIVQFASAQHGTATARYNAAGQIVRIVQADGARIDYTLDAAGRPTQKTAKRVDTASATVRFHYTAQGLARVEDSAQATAYDYDALGRQIAKRITLNIQNNTQPGYTIRTRYDASGRIQARQLADGNWLVFTLSARTGLTETIKLHSPILPALTQTLARWFNAPDLPLMIATRKTVVTGIEVSPLDGITRTVHGNGSVTDYRFDRAGRLAAIEHAPTPGNTTGAIFKASYQYDAGRRLVSEKRHVEKQNASDTAYRYAGWDRLALPTQANAQTQPAIQPRHDPAGRTAQDAHYRYHYDVWGKLQSVTDAKADNKVIATYTHNAYGERVKASHGGQARYYLYDNQKRVAELDQNGRILQQYLYLNDTPIAVIDSRNRGIEVIALHTDRRGAPVAASNERGKVIWTASYSAWGRAKVQTVSTAANDATFNLDLRLPGQWEDHATHLHYNYQRDYDPGSGRYLTPDPLGFPDGPDAYLYVGGDPINKVDPLGLYQEDIHYYMTFFLATVAGLDEKAARIIALATQYIDDNPLTWPVDETSTATIIASAFTNIDRLDKYHFVLGNSTDTNVTNNLSFQLDNLLQASQKAPTNCARFQFLGEYLHAFEDTYSHRDENNKPYTASQWVLFMKLGVGHGEAGSNPDYTYNHIGKDEFEIVGGVPIPSEKERNWNVNEARTLEMEKAVFEILQGYGDPSKAKNFSDIQLTLAAFNKTEGNENTPEGKALMPSKIEILNQALKDLGYANYDLVWGSGFDSYDQGEAANNRNKFLRNSDGTSFNQADYPGTILP